VRVLVRRADRLRDVPWAASVDVIEGDLADRRPSTGRWPASRSSTTWCTRWAVEDDFESIELAIARNVGRLGRASTAWAGSCTSADCIRRRPASLGTSLPDGGRADPARLGRAHDRAAGGRIIGSGSTSFEMIRHLTEVLPYMPAPRWVRSFIQPVAVRDVLHYLIRAAGVPSEVNRAFDIGGPDVYRYGQLMNGYAVEAGLPQRPIAALPVLTPWLAASG
jgi:uncharacterized protein YbjT (DUF2867 family)